MVKFERHQLSALFPDISEVQFNQIKNDIDQNGQHEEGKIFEGKILDGFNRYLITGDKFKYSQFEGTYKDAVQYVMSMNIHRRHLTDNQRFCLAAELMQIMKKKKTGHNQHTPKDNLVNHKKGENRTDLMLAKTLNVSSGSIYRAIHLKKHDPDKFQACKNGETTVNKAWVQSKREINGINNQMVEDIKFPDSYSHFTEVEKFLKQISMEGWMCSIYSENGKFSARFTKGIIHTPNNEHSITRAVVTALFDVRKQIVEDLNINKIIPLQSQAV